MSELFWYKLIFLTQLLVAEGLFTFRLKKKNHFCLRVAVALIISYAVAVFFPLIKPYAYSAWYTSLMFLCIFAVTFLLLKFVYDSTWINVFFYAVTAYTVQHISYQLFTLLLSSFGFIQTDNMYSSDTINFSDIGTQEIVISLIYVGIFLAVYSICYFIMGKRLKKANDVELKSVNVLFLAGVVLFVDVLINAIVIYIPDDISPVYSAIICFYNILCCILVFYMQYSIIMVKDMGKEIENISTALHQAQRQYALSKESIKLINLKCHDLKYQIQRFAEKGVYDEDSIKEINNAISIYDSTVKTGNQVLDVILTEKSLLCQDKGISLTCMVECDGIDFIREGDLYALFGNIIDNAIEAAGCLTEQEKRYIGLNINRVNKFITIKIDNYFCGEIKLDSDGLPITTKDNKEYHGFGMKSISAIVEKYNGTMSVVINEDIFCLNIMFSTI